MKYRTLKTFALVGLLFMLAAASVHAQSRNTIEANIPFDFAVGDTTLTAEEFSQLVALKQPLVQVRGQWVELRPEEIEAAIHDRHGDGLQRAQVDDRRARAVGDGAGQQRHP